MFGPEPLVSLVLAQANESAAQIKPPAQQRKCDDDVPQPHPFNFRVPPSRLRFWNGQGIHQVWQAFLPRRENSLPQGAPQSLYRYDQGNGIACAQNRPDRHIAWIMHPAIDPRERHPRRQWIQVFSAAPVKEERHRRQREPVGGVGGWHAAGSRAAQAGHHLIQRKTRARARDGILNRAND